MNTRTVMMAQIKRAGGDERKMQNMLQVAISECIENRTEKWNGEVSEKWFWK